MLSDEDERKEREDRERLRAIDGRLAALDRKREERISVARQLFAEQKALYDRRQAPQVEVERLYDEHGALGKRLAEIRGQREAARRALDAAVIALRELRLTFPPGDRVHPEQLRREIAALELRQQTRALTLEEENALIAQLRARTKELKEVESRVAVVAEHERLRRDAEAKVGAARAEVARLGDEFAKAKGERDEKMGRIRSTLEAAGGVVADLRAKGKERAAVIAEIEGLEQQMRELEAEGRKIVGAARARRDETRRTMRAYSPRKGGVPEDVLAQAADAQLEELLKRGKITLGG